MNTYRRWIAPALFPLAAMCLVSPAAGQSAYPSKPVHIVVPYTAGGGADVMVRALAQHLAKEWDKNVLVDNRPGASGMIGTEVVSRAAPDGHILLGHTSSYPATAAIRKTLPFDPARAVVPVATIAKAPLLLAVHPSLPARSVKELVALAKKHPGKLNYSSAGTGGNNPFATSLFASMAGITLMHVPYKGVSQATTALLSGEVELLFASGPAITPQLKSGRLRALGVTSLERSALMPELPSIAQSGVPGYSYELWWGIFAPAGLNAERLSLINTAVNKVLAGPEMKAFLSKQSAEPWPLSPAQISDLLPKEIERYRKIAKAAGIEPQ